MAGRWYCIVLLLAYLGIAIADEEVVNFDKWLDKYGYTREAVDYEAWKANMEYVVAHNQRQSSFKMSLNKFAHLTSRDHLVKQYKVDMRHNVEDSLALISDPLPEAVDWRSKGVVTPVRDQGDIESSYVFAAADAVSSFIAIRTGKLTMGSVEELTDCCHYHPCSGRFPESAFKCVHDIGGLCSEDTYKNSVKCACDNSTCTPFGTVQGGKTVPMNNESALAAALTMEPIQVQLKANLPSFAMYQSGVYDDPDCTDRGIDHTMLLIGYGTTDGGMPYWILKNSWGVNWGMDGYMLMIRNKNMCGIATNAIYPY